MQQAIGQAKADQAKADQAARATGDAGVARGTFGRQLLIAAGVGGLFAVCFPPVGLFWIYRNHAILVSHNKSRSALSFIVFFSVYAVYSVVAPAFSFCLFYVFCGSVVVYSFSL